MICYMVFKFTKFLPCGFLFAGIALAEVQGPHPQLRRAVPSDAQGAEDSVALSAISGPVLGFVFDEVRHGLRPIWGVPGACSLGDLTPLELDTLYFSPRQEYALGIASANKEVVLVLLESAPGIVSGRVLTEVEADPQRIEISSEGRSTAILNSDRGRVQIMTGLPRVPKLGRQVDISLIPRRIRAMTVSDNGDWVLLAASEGSSEVVFALGPEGGPKTVAQVQGVSAMSFVESAGSLDAAIADSGTNEVFLLRDISGTSTRIPLLNAQDGLDQPAAIRVLENRQLLVANSGAKTIIVLDLETAMTRVCQLDQVPTGLNNLRSSAVFRFTDLESPALWLFDAAGQEPRTVFVANTTGRQRLEPQLTQDPNYSRWSRIRNERQR